MTRIGELDRRRAQRAAATAREEQRRAEHFAATTADLAAALPERISRARERSQIALDLTIGAQAITVRRPLSMPDRMDGHRLVISRPDREGRTVEVELIFDMRNGGEAPSGEKSHVLSVRSSTEALLAGDLDLLLEWLVRCTDLDPPPAPEIAGVFEQRREEEREREREHALQRQKTRLQIAGYAGVLLVLLGLLLWILAPIGLGLGIWSRTRLEEIDGTAGVWSAGWFVLFAGALTLLQSILFGLWLIRRLAG